MASVAQTTTENFPPTETYNTNKSGLSLGATYEKEFDQELRLQNPTLKRLASASLPSSSVAASSAENSLNSSTASQLNTPINPHQDVALVLVDDVALAIVLGVLTIYGGSEAVKYWNKMPPKERTDILYDIKVAGSDGEQAAKNKVYEFIDTGKLSPPKSKPANDKGSSTGTEPKRKSGGGTQIPITNNHDGTEKCELNVIGGASAGGLGVITWYEAQVIGTPSTKSGGVRSTFVSGKDVNDRRAINKTDYNGASIKKNEYVATILPNITIKGECTFDTGYKIPATLNRKILLNQMKSEPIAGGARLFYSADK
jgi:hypothetical protein